MTHRFVALRSAFVIALAVFVSGCSYNRFTGQEESIKAAWSEVQNQLQRRNDLIGNLVETVKGYATQEREIFTQIAESRAKLSGATTPAATAAATPPRTSAGASTPPRRRPPRRRRPR